MPKRKNPRSPVLPVREPTESQTCIDKKQLQTLLSAARALYRNILTIENHSAESLLYATSLDQAIEAGHEALGTKRDAADRYIGAVGGLLAMQIQHAQQLLQQRAETVDTIE